MTRPVRLGPDPRPLALALGSRPGRRARPARTAERADAPPIITDDIKAGIEQHIASETERSGGHFVVPFEGRELKLDLVRVHVEYLASLGPQRHFACVDMVSQDGEFYDVDFFLEGDPAA